MSTFAVHPFNRPTSDTFSPQDTAKRYQTMPLALTLGLLLASTHSFAVARDEPAQRQKNSEAAIEKITINGKAMAAMTSTRLPLTAREIPQSISTISAELMSYTNMLDINDVMMHVPGVNVTLYDTQRPLYFARGFQITDFQVDNIPTYSGNTNQEYDTALYEHVEVIRGANGLFSGVGSPSATVNLIRKRPGREFAAAVTGTIGSWNMRRGVFDVSSPLTDQGTVRSRLVVASLDTDSFRDRYHEKKLAGLAIIEADVTEQTTIAFGLQDQDNKPDGTIWGTVPIYAADGSLAELPVSASFAPEWTHWQRQSGTVFADITHQFNDTWKFKAALNQTQGEVSSLRVYAMGFPDKTTGQGLKLLAGVGATEDTRNSLDLYLTGSYQAFGLEHDIIAGASTSKLATTTDLFSSVANWSYLVANAWDYDGKAPKPEYKKTGAYRIANTEQQGIYLANRFRLSQTWSLIGGARFSNWETATDNFNTSGLFTNTTGAYQVDHEFTPYAGVVWDFMAQHAFYLSYTDIFTPQNYKDKDNNLLAPVLGKNLELGLKSSFMDGALALNAALFKTAQDNYAVRDTTQPENSLPDGSSAYKGINGTESQGFEISTNGRFSDNWLVNAGYTYVDTKRHTNDKIWTNLPEHSAQLSSHYELSGALSGLTLGGGLNWQSDTVGYNLSHPLKKTGETYTQKSFVLANLYASWQFAEKLSSTLSITNLFDELYWANIDYANYGKPRQVSLSLKWQY